VRTLAFLCLAACSPAAKTPVDQRESLMQADRDFAAYTLQHGIAKGFLDHFAEDADYFPNGVPVVRGKPAIKAYFDGETVEPGVVLKWRPEYARAAESGELGYTFGSAEIEQDGKVLRRLKYVTIWKKQPDGRWKVIVDIGNTAEKPR
jgi:ketosteroid isomerase-like protein